MSPVEAPSRHETDPARRVILVVDDEPDLLELMELYLEESLPEVEVVTADTPGAALDLLQGRSVDLIISDYRMPLLDGIEFLALARGIRPDAHRILFTAYADDRLADRAREEAGVHAFFSKDLSPKELVAELGAILFEGPASR